MRKCLAKNDGRQVDATEARHVGWRDWDSRRKTEKTCFRKPNRTKRGYALALQLGTSGLRRGRAGEKNAGAGPKTLVGSQLPLRWRIGYWGCGCLESISGDGKSNKGRRVTGDTKWKTYPIAEKGGTLRFQRPQIEPPGLEARTGPTGKNP